MRDQRPARVLWWLFGVAVLLGAAALTLSPLLVPPLAALLLWSARPEIAAIAVGLVSTGLGVAGVWAGAALAHPTPAGYPAGGGERRL